MSTSTGYGVDVGMAVSAISSLRGNVSAMASNTTPANYADEALTTVSRFDKQVSISPAESTAPYIKCILKQARSSFVVRRCNRCM